MFWSTDVGSDNYTSYKYGKWQNADCRDMKDHLMKLDSKGTGRIPLDIFSRSHAGSAYDFTECFGALDL